MEINHEVLKAYAEAEDLMHFLIFHKQKFHTNDGEYQINIMAKVMALSVSFKAIIECERYTRPVEREKSGFSG
ncbi:MULTISPECIES: hypothetical protein [Paenibacillus]|uniref:hypothetical protein n=1 Tax=Paenibacillus TaxID=44249 RepID=UPI0009A61D6B|nr:MULTISPECIES: hypothetical protein [Paenibacillus]MCZ1265957.1 hypothetical protein [Paenibacillus tundrae]SLK12980.1 hypothetical protein SAMN06272722_10835 [Paenibacillus sp. RU5A]SOC72821.1 hypothetical protein SAMN05880581_10835 [Paenibacillus sp. RU26A]SOC75076.1 hypothetical protein SAMN05880586_10835 [Paenibacillus sp. RU5M]